jgi:hypothetical protein
MNPRLRALIRYWWLVLAGLVLGVIAGYLLYGAKSHQKYQAIAKIFVNSPSDPYLRTQQLQVTPQPPKSQVVRTGGRKGSTTTPTTTVQSVPSAPLIQAQAPDTSTLTTAANLYPQLILSDAVTRLSPVPPGCKLDASGLYASTNAFGVYKASPVPVIQVIATCGTRSDAIPTSQNRVRAFATWVRHRQNAAGIPGRERILVSELTAPAGTRTIGTPSSGLPVFAAVVVLLLFCGLAILLDRFRSAAAIQPAQRSASRAEA